MPCRLSSHLHAARGAWPRVFTVCTCQFSGFYLTSNWWEHLYFCPRKILVSLSLQCLYSWFLVFGSTGETWCESAWLLAVHTDTWSRHQEWEVQGNCRGTGRFGQPIWKVATAVSWCFLFCMHSTSDIEAEGRQGVLVKQLRFGGQTEWSARSPGYLSSNRTYELLHYLKRDFIPARLSWMVGFCRDKDCLLSLLCSTLLVLHLLLIWWRCRYPVCDTLTYFSDFTVFVFWQSTSEVELINFLLSWTILLLVRRVCVERKKHQQPPWSSLAGSLVPGFAVATCLIKCRSSLEPMSRSWCFNCQRRSVA